ncbi:patatin-like phospholipase family protein [Skermanella mucosa]|uniref:patatin-like phospholipase family protein n=1 Tax=Skermanella mucosa TaxID=1789672 RepID=UPI00192BE2DE|nr:patatin-like phospholipase family protein [Skermanella mucosa]UEM19729.1 patatin-like phospholipase family protein [Skermanella mucosa]
MTSSITSGIGKPAGTALVLSGGNALGAYHGGVHEEMEARGIRPDWVAGTSVGAITAAILAGNRPEHRLERLRQYWEEAAQASFWPIPKDDAWLREFYSAAHIANALAFGRPGIYRHRFPGALSALPWLPNDVAFYDQTPLRRTLERLIDFDLLNRAETRFSFVCIDVETGEEVLFDTSRDRIHARHLLAAVALMPAFQPIEVDGRLLCDAGLGNNLPVDRVLEVPPEQDMVCFASDLHSMRGHRPKRLNAAFQRTEDLVFSGQGRRNIAGLRREYALRERYEPRGSKVTLVHVIYDAPELELAGKLFDFSPGSIRDRWAAGRRQMARALDILARRPEPEGRFSYFAVAPDPVEKASQRR